MANETNLTPGAIEPDYSGVASVANTTYRTPGALDPVEQISLVNRAAEHTAAIRAAGRRKCEARHPRNKIKHCT
jgi:hypothetical protein